MVMAAKAYFDDTFRQEERPETRGGANKTSENVLASVRQHIESIQQVPSHWCRRRTAIKYLPSNLSIARLYRMYCEHHPDEQDIASEGIYRKVRLCLSSTSCFA